MYGELFIPCHRICIINRVFLLVKNDCNSLSNAAIRPGSATFESILCFFFIFWASWVIAIAMYGERLLNIPSFATAFLDHAATFSGSASSFRLFPAKDVAPIFSGLSPNFPGLTLNFSGLGSIFPGFA